MTGKRNGTRGAGGPGRAGGPRPPRICSLLPSATEIVAMLGMADCLAGVSAECDWPGQVRGLPVVSADANSYFSRPSPRIADGVAQLGHLIHPGAVPDPGLPAITIG